MPLESSVRLSEALLHVSWIKGVDIVVKVPQRGSQKGFMMYGIFDRYGKRWISEEKLKFFVENYFRLIYMLW